MCSLASTQLFAACPPVGGTTRLHDGSLLLLGAGVGRAVGRDDLVEEVPLYAYQGEARVLEAAEVETLAEGVDWSLSGSYPGVSYTGATDALNRREPIFGSAGGGPDPLGVAGGVPRAYEREIFAAFLGQDHVRERAAVVQHSRVRRGLYGEVQQGNGHQYRRHSTQEGRSSCY